MEEILVSVLCAAYNQEKYIADALQGFVEQKTDFRFEVIVHDDASQDRTTEIIREYEKKYPDIIKPIYQTENQYSKNPGIISYLMVQAAKGKYYALCEGDDYWTDPYKLQKQISYMETHPECTLCFTNAQCEEDGVMTGRRVIPWLTDSKSVYKPGDSDYDMGEMIILDYVPSASLVYRTDIWKNVPKLSPNSFTGDNFLRYFTTSQGYAHCIDEDTCVYRFGVPHSVSTEWKEHAEKKVAFLGQYASLLDDMNAFTENKYDAVIQEIKCRMRFEAAQLLQDYKQLRQKEFHTFYKKQGAVPYVKYLIKVYCPRIASALQKLQQK